MAFCRNRGMADMRYLLSAVVIMILPHFSVSASAGRSSRQALLFNIGTTPDPNSCTTPDGVEGKCTNLVACAELYGRLRTNPTPDFINFLRKSICRYEKATPVICCPKSEPVVSTKEPVDLTTTSSTTSTTSSTTTSSTTTSTTTTTTTTAAPTAPPPSGADLLPTTCGAGFEHVFLRIVGGTPTSPGRYPWIAALGYEDSEGVIEFLCGAALVTDQHVITAAHCVRNRNDLKVVRLGEHNLNIETDGVHEDFSIESRIIHENFNTISFANDIAVLKLNKKVTFRDRISPICLPLEGPFTSAELKEIGEMAIVAGWGSISFNNVSSSILLHVQLPFVTEETCRKNYEVFKQVVIDDTTLCAGKGGKDACQGDSGGPMMYVYKGKAYIIGVVSFGFRCAEPKFPGVYTRVAYYSDWILANLN